MIKVRELVEVSMHGTSWLMTPEEYVEFFATAQSLPKPHWYAEAATEALKTVRDKQKDEIERLRAELKGLQVDEKKINALESEIQEITDENYNLDLVITECKDKILELEFQLELKTKGVIEKPEYRGLRPTMFEPTPIVPIPIPMTDERLAADILASLRQDTYATSPVEPTPSPEPEVIAEVVAAPETVTEPAEETKYPAKKKTGRAAVEVFTAEQKEKYRTMIRAVSSHKEVTVAMVADTGMTLGSASQRYYALLKSTKASDAVKALDQRTKIIPQNPVTVITGEVNPRKLSKTVCAELAALPNFESIKEFKNACCENAILKDYNIIDLKGQYKIDRNLTR